MSIREIQHELRRCMESLGIEWTTVGDSIKARYASLEGTRSDFIYA